MNDKSSEIKSAVTKALALCDNFKGKEKDFAARYFTTARLIMCFLANDDVPLSEKDAIQKLVSFAHEQFENIKLGFKTKQLIAHVQLCELLLNVNTSEYDNIIQKAVAESLLPHGIVAGKSSESNSGADAMFEAYYKGQLLLYKKRLQLPLDGKLLDKYYRLNSMRMSVVAGLVSNIVANGQVERSEAINFVTNHLYNMLSGFLSDYIQMADSSLFCCELLEAVVIDLLNDDCNGDLQEFNTVFLMVLLSQIRSECQLVQEQYGDRLIELFFRLALCLYQKKQDRLVDLAYQVFAAGVVIYDNYEDSKNEKLKQLVTDYAKQYLAILDMQYEAFSEKRARRYADIADFINFVGVESYQGEFLIEEGMLSKKEKLELADRRVFKTLELVQKVSAKYCNDFSDTEFNLLSDYLDRLYLDQPPSLNIKIALVLMQLLIKRPSPDSARFILGIYSAVLQYMVENKAELKKTPSMLEDATEAVRFFHENYMINDHPEVAAYRDECFTDTFILHTRFYRCLIGEEPSVILYDIDKRFYDKFVWTILEDKMELKKTAGIDSKLMLPIEKTIDFLCHIQRVHKILFDVNVKGVFAGSYVFSVLREIDKELKAFKQEIGRSYPYKVSRFLWDCLLTSGTISSLLMYVVKLCFIKNELSDISFLVNFVRPIVSFERLKQYKDEALHDILFAYIKICEDLSNIPEEIRQNHGFEMYLLSINALSAYQQRHGDDCLSLVKIVEDFVLMNERLLFIDSANFLGETLDSNKLVQLESNFGRYIEVMPNNYFAAQLMVFLNRQLENSKHPEIQQFLQRALRATLEVVGANWSSYSGEIQNEIVRSLQQIADEDKRGAAKDEVNTFLEKHLQKLSAQADNSKTNKKPKKKKKNKKAVEEKLILSDFLLLDGEKQGAVIKFSNIKINLFSDYALKVVRSLGADDNFCVIYGQPLLAMLLDRPITTITLVTSHGLKDIKSRFKDGKEQAGAIEIPDKGKSGVVIRITPYQGTFNSLEHFVQSYMLFIPFTIQSLCLDLSNVLYVSEKGYNHLKYQVVSTTNKCDQYFKKDKLAAIKVLILQAQSGFKLHRNLPDLLCCDHDFSSVDKEKMAIAFRLFLKECGMMRGLEVLTEYRMLTKILAPCEITDNLAEALLVMTEKLDQHQSITHDDKCTLLFAGASYRVLCHMLNSVKAVNCKTFDLTTTKLLNKLGSIIKLSADVRAMMKVFWHCAYNQGHSDRQLPKTITEECKLKAEGLFLPFEDCFESLRKDGVGLGSTST